MENPYTQKPDYIYVFTCGCTYAKDDVFQNSPGDPIKCPIHKKLVKDRYVKCSMCGETFLTKNAGFASPICEICKINKPNVYTQDLTKIPRSYKGSLSVLQQRARQISIDCYDCGERSRCLDYIASINSQAGYLPCMNCKAYERVSIEHEHIEEQIFEYAWHLRV